MSKCQLYAKGEKLYPITKCENILMNDGTSLSTQLDNKANESEVIKKGNVDLDEMTERTIQAIQGGQGATFNLLSIPRDGSVTPCKTDFLTTNENMVERNNVNSNSYKVLISGNYRIQ